MQTPMDADLPPDRMTDAYENITFPKTSFADGNEEFHFSDPLDSLSEVNVKPRRGQIELSSGTLGTLRKFKTIFNHMS